RGVRRAHARAVTRPRARPPALHLLPPLPLGEHLLLPLLLLPQGGALHVPLSRLPLTATPTEAHRLPHTLAHRDPNRAVHEHADEREVAMKATYLRCEARVDPLGIDERAPRLSWQVESGRRGDRQSAYRVLVARDAATLKDNRGDLWDSGRVPGDATSEIVYR